METELQRLESSYSRNSISLLDEFHQQDIKYTSLKDILSSLDHSPTPRNNSCNNINIHDFNSSTISIRNQLVKHAASAYVQSAAVIATRDQNWLTSMWRRSSGRRRVMGSRWVECADGPIGFCVKVALRTVRRIMARANSQIALVVRRECDS